MRSYGLAFAYDSGHGGVLRQPKLASNDRPRFIIPLVFERGRDECWGE